MTNRTTRIIPASLRSFLRNTRGLSTVEYVIILVLVAVMAIGTWKKFGGTVVGKVSDSTKTIETEVTPSNSGK
jgi:Flp pilus assembly pilin Flp